MLMFRLKEFFKSFDFVLVKGIRPLPTRNCAEASQGNASCF